MKNPTYYFINYKGEKQRARSSANEYKYGLAVRWGKEEKENEEEYCVKCSIRKDIIESEIRYLLKYDRTTPERIRVVEVFKE